MNGKIMIAIAIFAFLVVFPGLACSAGRASDEDAMEMVEMAGRLIEKQGDLALPEISNPEGRFFNREKSLYVFVYNDESEVVANPCRPDLVGVRFPENSPAARIVAAAMKEGCCWISYSDRECCEDDPHETKVYGKLFRFDWKDYIVCANILD